MPTAPASQSPANAPDPGASCPVDAILFAIETHGGAPPAMNGTNCPEVAEKDPQGDFSAEEMTAEEIVSTLAGCC